MLCFTIYVFFKPDTGFDCHLTFLKSTRDEVALHSQLRAGAKQNTPGLSSIQSQAELQMADAGCNFPQDLREGLPRRICSLAFPTSFVDVSDGFAKDTKRPLALCGGGAGHRGAPEAERSLHARNLRMARSVQAVVPQQQQQQQQQQGEVFAEEAPRRGGSGLPPTPTVRRRVA